jgi:tRNA pseudouridine55 synthase
MSGSEQELEGVLRVDKAPGPTSHDIVARSRRALGTRRVGHTGTLDPFASGLLILCVGRATRIAEYLTGLDKRYEATIMLGIATDTDDHTGAVVAQADVSGIEQGTVEHALSVLRGRVAQVPPQYSAKKRGGERAYAAARAGRPLELEAVQVSIHRLEITSFHPPLVGLDVHCSSGTYIRAIARDLGAALGVGAHLSALRRTAVGAHGLAGALTLEELAEPGRARTALEPVLGALAHLPQQPLDDAAAADIRHGRRIRLADDPPDAPVVAITAGGALLGIGERSGGVLRPRKVLLS